jgi:hypothetical protein
MLSFEMCAFIALAIAFALILLGFFAAERMNPEKATLTITNTKQKQKRFSAQPKNGTSKCPYGFGYLSKQDKNAPVPEECLSCSRLVECYKAGD